MNPNSPKNETTQLPKPATAAIDSEAQTALLELCHEAMSSLDLAIVLKKLTKHAKIVLNTDNITFAMIETTSAEQVFYRRLRSPEEDYEASEVGILPDNSLSMKAYRTGKIATTEDYLTDNSFRHNADFDERAQKSDSTAIMVVPVLVQNVVIALIGATKKSSYKWTENDVTRAEQFASLGALAIHNALAYRQLENLNKNIITRNQELEAVQEFNQRLRGPIELKPLLERAIALLVEALKADAGSLHLPDKNTPGLLIRAVTHSVNFHLPDYANSVVIGSGVSGKVFTTGQKIVVEDVAVFLQQNPNATINPDPQWRAGIFIPLLKAEKIVGVLNLFGLKANCFTTEQVRFAEIMAAQIATAIAQVSQIEAQKEQERIAAALMLAKTAAHELNQPLTLLQLELEIASEYLETLDESTLERMQQAVRQMAERLKTYQKLVRLEIIETTPGFPVIDWDKAIQKRLN